MTYLLNRTLDDVRKSRDTDDKHLGKLPANQFDQSGRASEGLAFVAYANESHAEAAMEAFNGASAKGQPIGVSYAFTMPGWVRGALGMRRDSATALPTFGLLGRIQQERPAGRHQFSPYDSSRPRGPRSSFPPGKPHRSSNERDYRRSTDSFGSGVRTRGGPGYRGVVRPRGMGERTNNSRSATVKSSRDLDKELEAFMGSTNSGTGRAANPSNAEADVQMAE